MLMAAKLVAAKMMLEFRLVLPLTHLDIAGSLADRRTAQQAPDFSIIAALRAALFLGHMRSAA
jgi:hypothetical protein